MKKAIFFLFISVFIFSCRKDKAIPEGIDNGGTVTQVGPDYVTTVGSFWVYDIYKVDSSGNETFFSGNDTVRIIKDSIINGNQYAVYKGHYEGSSNQVFLRRDSFGYFVDEKGEIFCSFSNFTDTFYTYSNPPYSYIIFKMAHKDSIISAPVGTFTASKFEISQYFNPNSWADYPLRIGTYYSKGNGVVKHRTHAPPSGYMDSKLVSYYIAP